MNHDIWPIIMKSIIIAQCIISTPLICPSNENTFHVHHAWEMKIMVYAQ